MIKGLSEYFLYILFLILKLVKRNFIYFLSSYKNMIGLASIPVYYYMERAAYKKPLPEREIQV